MTRAKAPGKIDQALDAAIAAELTECYRKHDVDVVEDGKTIAKKGELVYSLRDRLSVMDRAIKIEAIKAKLPDDGWGAKFGDNKGGEGAQ